MAESKLRLADFLPYQLSITSNAVSDLIARSYRSRFGLRIAEWRLMAVLGECESATQRDLAMATAMDKVSVNRASKILVDRGLVSRVPNSADGRSHHLALTKNGRALYDEIVPEALSIETHLEKILGNEEAMQLSAILAKLRKLASELDQ
ncbi:MarR family winged helix-turn-helix transcriptional regulator [Sphingorhabdus arenilitoris]|uniref:MarR family winged helix-turn-helix transcriptional regulator n=1 Tax=Sphingorhabdus arenilitoris TaxID=1490041 RepID=A0ABV8RGJ0_9SPHN